MMVAVSDNSATNVLIDRVGMENVNALMDSLGLSHTRLRRKMMDIKAAAEGKENVSTPREMMTLLEQLYRGKVLNKPMTEDFFKMLSTHKESFIPRNIPDDVRIANKPGELEAVRNDSGVVFVQNRPYVISVMTTYLRNERAGEEAISTISGAAYRMFDRLGRGSEYGRVVSPNNNSKPENLLWSCRDGCLAGSRFILSCGRDLPMTVRRLKTYTGAQGYVYQYYFVGKRPALASPSSTEFIFDVTSDRKTMFAVSVFLPQEAVTAWASQHGRQLTDAEQYAAAKMRLFQGFDEIEHMMQDGRSLVLDPATLESLLATLGVA
jgi:hypothetical protein